MKRTGLFGGSFNPPHKGHISLARQVLLQGLADEVWLMVSPRNPLKRQADLLDEHIRLELAQTAVEEEPHLFASDFEFQLERPSYTWKTLQALHKAYPGRTFPLIIGSDNWLRFDRWAHGREIAEHHEIIVYPRPGYAVDETWLPPNVQLLHCPLFPFSSTEIRQFIREGRDISEMVPEKVLPQILKHYGN